MTMRVFRIEWPEFRDKFYPAFSRRATQVCILSSALERIVADPTHARTIARVALDKADAFGWKARMNSTDTHGVASHEPGQQK